MKESFTLLKCTKSTTIGLEGCAEHAIVRADHAVDRAVRRLWARASVANRADLAKAQQAWLAFRKAACTSESDSYRGGTLAPVVAGQCLARLSAQRARELNHQVALGRP